MALGAFLIEGSLFGKPPEDGDVIMLQAGFPAEKAPADIGIIAPIITLKIVAEMAEGVGLGRNVKKKAPARQEAVGCFRQIGHE